jgi:type I restriction enzyme S subunit
LENFAFLSNAPNGVAKLRELILQLAVEGKLTAQDPSDDPASKLLQKINADKEQIAKTGNENEEAVAEAYKSDELLTIPTSWEWVRLDQIANTIHYGYTTSANELLIDVRLLRITDIQNGKVDWARVPGCEIDKEKVGGYKLANNDILIARTGGTIGKSYLVENLDLVAVFASYLIRVIPNRFLFAKYLKMFFESDLYWKQLYERSMGTGQPNVNATSLKSLAVPLPPFAEQKRIFTKVYELMRLCDQLEERQQAKRENQVSLNTAILAPLNKAPSLSPKELEQAATRLANNFDTLYDSINTVSKLRSTILQLAVQGKLVRQDPDDEPASELIIRIHSKRDRLIEQRTMKKPQLFPAIQQNEIPFKLPEKWQWARLNDVFDVRDGTHDTPKYVADGFPLVTSKNLYTGVLDLSNVKYISESDHRKISERSRAEKDEVLFAMIGSIGNPVIVQTETEFSIKNVALFKYYSRELSEPMFLHLFLRNAAKQMREESAGGVQSFVSLGFLRKYLFPVPPLAEQKRIVVKVNQLMSLCDELEAKLRQAEANSAKLMNAAVKHVLACVRDVSKTTEEVFA